MSGSRKYAIFRGRAFSICQYLIVGETIALFERASEFFADFDAIIKVDNFGVLRFNYVHLRIDQLITNEFDEPALFFAFIDPKAELHVLVSDRQSFLGGKKIRNRMSKMDAELKPITDNDFVNLSYPPHAWLSKMISQEQIQLVKRCKVVSIDEIRLRCQANLYTMPEELIQDIRKLLAWNQLFRSNTYKSFQYLSLLYQKIIQIIARKDFIRKFNHIKQEDHSRLFKYDLQFKTEATKWPIVPTSFREYQNITEYVPTPQNRRQVINERIKSLKVPEECKEGCVCLQDEHSESQEFCTFSLVHGWETKCPNRARNIQCNHSDPQMMKKCRNAEIKKLQRKRCKRSEMEEGQIEQCLTWGIDLYTRNIIYHCLPQIDIIGVQKFQNQESKNHFIEKTFNKAINFIGEVGYSIQKTCDFIKQHSCLPGQDKKVEPKSNWTIQEKQIKVGQRLFSKKDYEYADLLLRNYQICVDKDVFRIYTKGKGAKCIEKEGIKQGRFIVQYYGELYEPWRWYDREDFIKEIMKKKSLKNFIPEFYNIYLQKHADQPLGYDMLIVDPSRKGNFSSRFSHSCNPNCGTIITVSDGKYCIGMYSFRDIEYGEQLTFDYCSMTESNYEHLHSICLCGTKKCRGNYLQLSNSKIFNNLMDVENCFYQRNSIILKSIGDVSQQDLQICGKYNIKSGFLKDTPSWMVRWMARLLLFIQSESQIYKQSLIQNWKKQYPWDTKESEKDKEEKIELYSQTSKQDLKSLRFQNLITSIDKMKFFISKNNCQFPPIILEENVKIQKVLISFDDSIIKQVQQALITHKCEHQAKIVEYFIHKIEQTHKIEQKLAIFRLCCLIISHKLLFQNQKGFSNTLFSDILYFYAFTHTYFSVKEYTSFQSEQIVVAISEITGERTNHDKKQKTKKKYSTPFVWGQLVSWFKQTIVNPEASLSQDRRGTLSYPTIESILKSKYPYEKNRSGFLKVIHEKPANSWPPAQGCSLSFKNPYKLYGSMMFENVHNRQKLKSLPQQNLLESCLAAMNQNLKCKLQLFKMVEKILENTDEQSPFYDILLHLNLDFSENIPIELREQKSEGEPRKRVKKDLSD